MFDRTSKITQEKLIEQKERMALLMLLHESVRQKILPPWHKQNEDMIISAMNEILVSHLDREPASTEEIEMLAKAFTTINDLFFRVINR